jgi:hypothetical protein
MSKVLGLLLVIAVLALAVPALAQSPFSDVPMDHWAYQAVDTLTKAGLIEGYPDGTFKGNQPMTRYEFAMLIARAMQSKALQGPAGPCGPAGSQGMGGGAGLTPEQCALLERLKNEFMPELKQLRNDLNDLESRVADLEAKPEYKQKIIVSGDVSVRLGAYGTKLELGASESTGYPYPGVAEETWGDDWFAPAPWGGINIPVAVVGDPNYWDFDGDGASSVPISDAVKDAFKAPDFGTMRTRVNFSGDLGQNTSALVSILADTRGNLTAPHFIDTISPYAGENAFYSDGLMDSVRVDEAWMKYSSTWIRPWSITAGKLYWGTGQGLLVNNSQHPTKSARVDIALIGDVPGYGVTYSFIGGMLDRQAFLGGFTSGTDEPAPLPDDGQFDGSDNYAIHNLTIPLGSWKLGGTYLGTGFGTERGWSADISGKAFGLDFWGEYAQLLNFPGGCDETEADIPVKLSEEDTAWLAGVGYNSSSLAIKGQYGEIEPLYALSHEGWDPTGIAATFGSGAGYLNLPLSLLHPVEEFNPHYINWLDRPLFLDPTNIAKGWEAQVTLKKLFGEKTPITFRYADGEAYEEEYLGYLFHDGGSLMSKPDKWRDADSVWSVGITHMFSDAFSANLTYGQRETENVMSPNNPDLVIDGDVEDDPIKVLRLDLSVAF